MSDFLLELLSEEIPARMQAKARADLERLFAEQLAAHGLKAQAIRTYSTPRRLALIASGLPEATEVVREETKGPREGAPPQALEGFCRKLGLSVDQLEVRDGTYFAVVDKPGQKTAEILGPAIAAIIRDFPWPKSMRWGGASARSDSLKWVRPLHRIVALFGDAIVEVDVPGVMCGAATLGHRFHHPGEITIGGAHDYADKLKMAKVLVDHEERQDIVRSGAAKAAADAGYALIEDEGLVIENAGLTEWPVPLLGTFDPDYLDVPEEVIQLTARSDQKYFVMRGKDGRLAPAFICTANIDSKDPAAVVAGNQRVLAARLSDARFFWENDLKVPLESLSAKLGDIVFHEKLGTVADKVERVAEIAYEIADQHFHGIEPELAAEAAKLAKNDLVTGLVGEFGELQGIIGGHLARAQGEGDVIADAVRDHYKPVGQGDDVPTAPVSIAVSLADKIDTLVGFFGAGMPPTGSKDPFALRRAALAVIRLSTENDLDLSIDRFVEVALEGYAEQGVEIINPSEELRSFFEDRLKVQQRDIGVRHDILDAVFGSLGNLNGYPFGILSLKTRIDAVAAFVQTAEGADLMAAYKRAANVLKQANTTEEDKAVEADILAKMKVAKDHAGLLKAFDFAKQPEELDLFNQEMALADRLVSKFASGDYLGTMRDLATLREPLDAFFDAVMVNDEDPVKRQFRYFLLQTFKRNAQVVADFSKIEG